jgi:hypothetical protein
LAFRFLKALDHPVAKLGTVAGDQCDRQVFGEVYLALRFPTAVDVGRFKISRLKSEHRNILYHLFNVTQDMLVLFLAEVGNLAARHRESPLFAVHDIRRI